MPIESLLWTALEMSVYKLFRTHYIKLNGPAEKEAKPNKEEQCDNLKLLLKDSNSKLINLAQTVKELRRQLKERDATIASLTGHKPNQTRNKCSLEIHRLQPDLNGCPQNLVVDVSSDLEVQLKVEYVDSKSKPTSEASGETVLKVASTVVSRQDKGGRQTSFRKQVSLDGATATGFDRSSPIYSSLMWRTRQRAREAGYRFVWSRCGKILVKKDVDSPAMFILDENDLHKMA